MIDSSHTPPKPLSDTDRNNLVNRIDELEQLLAKKKTESKQAKLPRLKVGTDGIPVLVDLFSQDDLDQDLEQTFQQIDKDDQLINDIINKVDKEISGDLDELILMLKDSIIDEVKTRLLKEFHIKKDNADKKE
ncbi:MAG: hypothetical protein DHS20C09_02620 [marine bacterium B5-7]|nr:MAG: hypothetical protein DHS20C09_02620 [marine bacterium B5-7]